MLVFSKYALYVCVFIYIYIEIINKHSTHIYYVNKNLILDAINRLTALIYIYVCYICCCSLWQLSFSPTTPMSSHVRVLALLGSVLTCCGGLAVLCALVGHLHGMHTVAFMAAEVRTLSKSF